MDKVVEVVTSFDVAQMIVFEHQPRTILCLLSADGKVYYLSEDGTINPVGKYGDDSVKTRIRHLNSDFNLLVMTSCLDVHVTDLDANMNFHCVGSNHFQRSFIFPYYLFIVLERGIRIIHYNLDHKPEIVSDKEIRVSYGIEFIFQGENQTFYGVNNLNAVYRIEVHSNVHNDEPKLFSDINLTRWTLSIPSKI